MKSLLICFYLLIFAGAAFGQNAVDPKWVGVNSNDSADIYVDKTSLKRNGDIVTAWIKLVVRSANMSAKQLKEYNCKTTQARRLAGTAYKGLNTDGPQTILDQADWKYITRETAEESVLEYVCKEAPKQGWLDKFLSK